MNRLAHIDALRGVAVISVVFCHMLPAFSAYIPADETQTLVAAMSFLRLGYYGVFLFFIVSGFVVPFTLPADSRLRGQALGDFALRRFFRLYPLYWASLLVTLLVMGLTGIGAGDVGLPAPLSVMLANVTMLQGFVDVPGLQWVYWTLKVEMAFYLLCGGLFALGWLRRPAILAASGVFLLVLAGLAATGFTLAETITRLGFADALALVAMLLGLLWRLAFVEKAGGRGAFFLLLGLFALSLPLLNHQWALQSGAARPLAEALVETANIAAAFVTFSGFFLARSKDFTILRWLGEISYSIYLLHLPILLMVEAFVSPRLAGAPFALHAALALPLILVISDFVHRRLEQPMIAEGRRLAEKSARAEAARA